MVNAYNIQHQFDSIMFSDSHHDADHVKMHTLKNIKTSGGSEIVLDYEPNQLSFFDENYDAGGIRIKNMVLKDGTGSVDSVHYHYTKEEGESSGRMMLRPARGKMLFYASYFADQVYSEEVEDEGHGIFNTGNNGIIYDYVIEERVGSGSIAYYSHTPAELYETTLGYPYWLMGLPLGKVEYDVEGRLVSMQKNSYYASLAPFYSNAPPGFIQGASIPFPFNQTFLQLQSFGFYMDAEELSSRFPDTTIVTFYDGQTPSWRNPRNSYLSNFEPRTHMIIPDQSYPLYHGGKVVLKETTEYVFDQVDESTTTGPRFQDLFDALPDAGYIMDKTTFYYGTKHCDPVRITKTRSDGDQVDIYRQTVADVDESGALPPVIHGMKASNMIAPLLQERKYVTRGNVTRLFSEKIVEYGKDTLDGNEIYFPVKEFELPLLEPQIVDSLPLIAPLVYTVPTSESDHVVAKFAYNTYEKIYRQEERILPGETTAIVHDTGNGKPILGVKNARREEVDAFDRRRTLPARSVTDENFLYFGNVKNLKLLFNEFFEKTMEIETQSAIYSDSLMLGELHQALRDYVLDFWCLGNQESLMQLREIILLDDYMVVEKYEAFFKRHHPYLSLSFGSQDYLKILTISSVKKF
jgi:hypothetical protein